MQGVYLETSVIDLKPRMLEFLTTIASKVTDATYAVSLKKKEIAELVGKDTRTITRYLSELEKKEIIQTKARRGRAGGTIIKFNSDLIKFNNPESALVIQEDTKGIDELLEVLYPKRPKSNEPKKRNRRTKQQILEDKLLQTEKQKEIDALNEEAKKQGMVPSWSWFQKTDDPVGNYKTYLLTRMYNRYAILFTDEYASKRIEDEEDYQLLSDNYDVLPEDFYKSARWEQFDKVRQLCEKNNIHPASYLSAQFARSAFINDGEKNPNKLLPYINSLVSDTAYKVYEDHMEHYSKLSVTLNLPFLERYNFAQEVVLRALVSAYQTAHRSNGFMELRHSMRDFFTEMTSTDKESALLSFYDMTISSLQKSNVSVETRDTIKKYIMLQSLSQVYGSTSLEKYRVLGSEFTRLALTRVDGEMMDKSKKSELKARILGKLLYPDGEEEFQLKEGRDAIYQFELLDETPHVLRLIMERKGLHVSIKGLHKALEEYGKDKVPVDELSTLDVTKVMELAKSEGIIQVAEKEETNIKNTVEPREEMVHSSTPIEPQFDVSDLFNPNE